MRARRDLRPKLLALQLDPRLDIQLHLMNELEQQSISGRLLGEDCRDEQSKSYL